jgi:opacity protein-like surface antigen
MRKTLPFLFVVACIALLASTALAQTNNGINRVEGFGGYSYANVDSGLNSNDLDPEFADSIDTRFSTHGFNGSVTGNFNKYVGAKFDYSFHQRSEGFSVGSENGSLRYRLHQFLGGVQLKNNMKDGPRFKPFAHVLAGVARQSLTLTGPAVDTEFGGDVSSGITDFAMAFGGGIDVRVNKNIDVRVFQFDYNPIFVRTHTIGDFVFGSVTQNNIRLSFGIVIH